MAGKVLGCAVYYAGLNERLGISHSFECTVEDTRLDPSRPWEEGEKIVAEAVGLLSSITGLELELERGPKGWEYSGRMFNLYTWRLSGGLGVARLTEIGGRPLGVYGALAPEAGLPRRRGGPVASEGRVMRLVYLEPVSSDSEPPGQKYVSRNPIYAVEGIPRTSMEWSVSVEGSVRRPLRISLEELLRMALERRDDPFHCVTGWSLRGRTWEGVPLRLLLDTAGAEGRWVAAESVGGYTSVLPMEYALDALLVYRVDGGPLPREEGGPLRLFVPRLYGWKHTKWVTRITVLPDYEDGYWEALGYHERGLAAAAERFKVRNPAIAEEGRLPEPLGPRPPR